MTDLLFLAHRIPYPPDKGDKIRSWHLLRHLAERHRVHLGAFVDDPDDWRHEGQLRRVCASVRLVDLAPWRRLAALRGLAGDQPLTFAHLADRGLAAWVDAIAATHRPGIAFAFSSGMAPYLRRPGLAGARKIVDLVDLDSAKWGDYAAAGQGPAAALWRREARLLAAAETAITRWADAVLLVSGVEAGVLCSRPGVPAERVHHVGNGVDLAYFTPRQEPGPEGPPLLVFTGAMGYRPNVDAVTWLADAVLPDIRRRMGEVGFAIVGAGPDSAVRRLARRPGITVTGRVADVRPWLARATLAVAPLRIARGVQNKVLEAMAMGRPVLCSPQAAAGIEAVPERDLVVADGAEAMIEAVVALLRDPARRAALGRAGRRRVQETYDWRARLRCLDLLLEPSDARRRSAA